MFDLESRFLEMVMGGGGGSNIFLSGYEMKIYIFHMKKNKKN